VKKILKRILKWLSIFAGILTGIHITSGENYPYFMTLLFSIVVYLYATDRIEGIMNTIFGIKKRKW
jgi:hypothetical protein